MSSEAPLRETPTLERLLNRLGRELRLQVWMHGLGTVLLVAALWCVWTFIADWGLSVPRPMRIVHALLLVGLPVWFAWRSLLRPLRHVPDRAGLAVLLERAQTQKDELLVSAAQLQACPDGDPVLVQRVLAEAESRARSVETDAVIDKSGPRLRLFGGFISVGALLAVFASQGELTGIFVNHLLGGTQAWPRQTTLLVELPLPGGDDALRTVPGAIEGQPAEIIARVARGSDVRVVVTAEGKLPDRVTLHFEGGEELMLTPAGGATFRQVIRSCQDDLSFWVTGGDDNDREPMVRIEVLQPPDVAGLAVAVQPPAYSGLEPSLEFDRDVEVLAGSELLVHVLPDPPGATGHVLLLPEDRQIPLEPAPFPTADGSATRPGLAFRLNPDRSLRFRVELTDEEGLENPDPGLFSIAVVEDRAPDLVVLGPGRGDVETVVGGTLALRVRAEDDFGLGALSWSARPYLAEDAVGVGGELEQRPLPRTEDTAVRALGRRRIEVAELSAPGEELSEGQQFALVFHGEDNRAPEPGTSQSHPVRVRVVTPDDLLRRVQDRLARARVDASRLAELAREKRARVEELLDALQSDSPLDAGDQSSLAAALTGARLVQGDARSIARDLASVTETVLYARLDEKAGTALELLDSLMADSTDREFHHEPWAELASAHTEGRLGAPGFAGNLIDILGLSVTIAEDSAQSAVAAIDSSAQAPSAGERQDMLVAAVEAQTLTLSQIEDLLERLAEWDNFQSVLALTRDILNRQQSLTERLREYGSDR